MSLRGRARSLGMLALLQAALPLDLAVTAVAVGVGLVTEERRTTSPHPRTVLLSGGKMSKALALARAFSRAGHRVVLVESAAYRLSGHRFSRCVDAWHTVPKPDDPGYAQALLDVVLAEGVDVYVPVCSPLSSRYDARAAPLLTPHCEVVHADADLVAQLDDKAAFIALAASLGLDVPDSHRVTSAEQVLDLLATAEHGPYVLKSIAYDPVHRLDLTPLPRPTAQETEAFVRALPISATNPWLLQTLMSGREYCTHGTVRDGRLQVHVTCPSSPFQVNYASVDLPAVVEWVRGLVEPLGVTGQVSLDLMVTPDGRVLPIECNPRTHSAVTLYQDDPDLPRAYLEDGVELLAPRPGTRPTYWLHHELWRLLRDPSSLPERVRVVLQGRDALFDPHDPLPFLLVPHLQVPSLLLAALRSGADWIRVDVNIGKLVQASGD